MPNIKSAMKRMRTSEEDRQRNFAKKSEVKHCRGTFMEATNKGDKEKGAAAYKEYCAILDNAAKKGIIKKNTACRRKARAANNLRKLG